MLENDIKRNGSGYYDETPIKTGLFTSSPQAGEIWETTEGKELLVLKNQGNYCNTLCLQTANTRPDQIEIISREKRWANPGMVGYIVNRGFAQYVKTLPEARYLDIMQAVGDRLGVCIKVSKAGTDKQDTNSAEIDKLKAEIQDLEKMYRLACATVKEEQERSNSLRQALEKAEKDKATAEEKAALNEKMLYALMDRICTRGDAR